jgi:hypothetical protein
MTRSCPRRKTVRCVLAASAFCASALLLVGLWFPVTPFNVLLGQWGYRVLSLLAGGFVMVRAGGILQRLLPIALAPCFAIPFWGLGYFFRFLPRWCQRVANLAAALVVLLAIVGALAPPHVISESAAEYVWWIIEIGISACLGVLLVSLGWFARPTPDGDMLHSRWLGYGLLCAGLAITSYLLLPIGLICLALVYLKLGLVFLRGRWAE